MRTLHKTAGLLFLAASSVYIDGVTQAGTRSGANPADADAFSTVKLLDAVEKAGAVEKAFTDTKPLAATEMPGPIEAVPDAASTGKSVTADDVNISDAGTVEIHVNDASLVEVLRMLSLQSQRNIIASKEVRGTITANLYDVTVREALDAVLHANGYAYREKGNFIYVYTVAELDEIQKSERVTSTEIFRLYYTPAANAVTMIKPVLSGSGQVAFTTAALSGIAEGGDDVGGNSHATEDLLVITDYADNLAAVKKILKEIDTRPQQVLVEATILRASLSDDNALGVDINAIGGVDFNTVLTGSNGQINGANFGSGNPSLNGGNAYGGGTGSNFSNSVNGGLKLGFVNSDIGVFISALESITDTTVLANPKVLALNKQKGEVLVGRSDGYLTTTVTESSAVQTVEFLQTGTRLIFRPYIGNDGYIRMEIHPEDSSGGLSDANLPFKITTEVTSNVMVKDGQTIVIGGLFREESTTSKGQVPFLGNLPLAGALFRRQRDRTVREEVIILLTPHIVKDDIAYAAVSEEALRDIHKLRVGVRQGMMPWGRERLAEGEYEKALTELNKAHPNRKSALWHLDAATNLNPKFLEAIKLKQELTGREVTSVDNSTTSTFITRAILADVAVLPPTTQPMTPIDATKPEQQPAAEPVKTADVPTTQPVASMKVDPTAEPQTPLVWSNIWCFGWVWDQFTSQVLNATLADKQKTTVVELLDEPLEEPLPMTVTELPLDVIGVGGNK